VWQIRTHFPPRQLKCAVLRRIETELGRIRTQDRHRARTIDLDLVLYGELVIRETDLVIPDPEIRQRPFLAIPLFEINPALVLPDTQEKLQHVIARFNSVELEPVPAITGQLKQLLNDE
jgi:7,8-dihydro-6-hydroxymethylpterin-pyrophosphokinase